MAKGRLNPRQEKFVREYVKNGGNGTKAYVKAGYQASTKPSLGTTAPVAGVCASQLLKNPKVISAITAQHARIRTRHDYTVDTILGELEDDRRLAHASAQAGAAVSATIGKAKLLGMIVDRKEVGTPGDFAALDSIQAILALAAKELGNDAAAMLSAIANQPTIELTAEESTKED